ncbi:MAG TPA: flagellar export protein FliJ [Candidatus Synoicihabitans sp.]|nr:flagellar export protein FliJ [Candidatus Synoicihabitans sp.]
MKRFRFPLQSVATVRAWHERDAREAFGAAMRAYTQAESRVQEERKLAQQTESVLRAGRSKTFRPLEQAAFAAAYQTQLQVVRQVEQARVEAKTAVDRARDAWHAARSKLRAVEQLEHRARQQHRVEQERADQTAMDELASIRATRSAQVLT